MLIVGSECEEWVSVSRDVTFNSINWQKNLEGGLWLQSNSEAPETTRTKNRHPWIMWDSDSESSSVDNMIENDEELQTSLPLTDTREVRHQERNNTVERWLETEF